ncbi:Alpha/Beta hydrolase protein [Massariosphaeria phaeospora]|uniref:Alpha/Beta hydrolase protein n=1 Tax=Massariosphaeria phaeospora TaxID=100035 RepID=A0A7C8M9W7_9PLEO|nr:Alpha/Beta hydrolase protein [Massariosphaeria phaeospora]
MSPPTSSISASGSMAASKPAKIDDYVGLAHAPRAATSCTVKPISIKIDDGADGAVAGGGVVGPSSMYVSLADKLASLEKPVTTLRLDYRYPARNKLCVRDVFGAMNELERQYHISNFVLVGWSFGGAPVFTVGGSDKRVIGCATVASQTAETEGVKSLAPRPLLLLHGTGDRTLSYSCSERLFAQYGSTGDRELKLFEGDDHALTRNSLEAERRIGAFILKCAAIDANDETEATLNQKLVQDEDKIGLMEKGGDLRGHESVK